jgi:hypothetical protein
MLPDAVTALSPVELTVRGAAIWGENARGPCWIEPFFARVRIAEAHDTAVNYELRFGDAVRGLGTFPYGKRVRRAEWFFPTEWLCRFSKGGDGDESGG